MQADEEMSRTVVVDGIPEGDPQSDLDTVTDLLQCLKLENVIPHEIRRLGTFSAAYTKPRKTKIVCKTVSHRNALLHKSTLQLLREENFQHQDMYFHPSKPADVRRQEFLLHKRCRELNESAPTSISFFILRLPQVRSIISDCRFIR